MIYTLFFRYETPRGLPPDTGVSFALLPLILSAVEADPSFEKGKKRKTVDRDNL